MAKNLVYDNEKENEIDSMQTVSPISIENAIPKKRRTQYSRNVISRKIVAFDVLINAEQTTRSHREASSILEVPESTMRSWRQQEHNISKLSDEVVPTILPIFI